MSDTSNPQRPQQDLDDAPRPARSATTTIHGPSPYVPILSPSDYVAAEFWRGMGQGIGIAAGMLVVGGLGYLVFQRLNAGE